MKNLLIKGALFAAVPFILYSCSEESKELTEADEQFCKCLEATTNMDEKSSLLMDGNISQEDAKVVKELGLAMKAACKNYAVISKKEGLRLKEQCENR